MHGQPQGLSLQAGVSASRRGADEAEEHGGGGEELQQVSLSCVETGLVLNHTVQDLLNWRNPAKAGPLFVLRLRGLNPVAPV